MEGKHFVLGGLACAAVGGLFYWLYSTYHNSGLDPIIEEYLQEIEKKLKQDPDKPPSLELTAQVALVFEEIENYLYLQDNEDFEEIRLQTLNVDNARYQELLKEAINAHEEYRNMATQIIETRLKISMDKYRELLSSAEAKEVKSVFQTCKKPYKIPAESSKENTKKAYVEWVKTRIPHIKLVMQMLQAGAGNPDYEKYAIQVYLFNKHFLRDRLLKEFEIREKHLEQLLVHHELLGDPEIIAVREELNSLPIILI